MEKSSIKKYKITSVLMLVHALFFELLGGCASLIYLLSMSRVIASDSILIELGARVGLSLQTYPFLNIFVTLGALGIVTGIIRLHAALFLRKGKKAGIIFASIVNVVTLIFMLYLVIKVRVGIPELLLSTVSLLLMWMQYMDNKNAARVKDE